METGKASWPEEAEMHRNVEIVIWLLQTNFLEAGTRRFWDIVKANATILNMGMKLTLLPNSAIEININSKNGGNKTEPSSLPENTNVNPNTDLRRSGRINKTVPQCQ